jgi:hypothetical protein
MTNSWRPTDDCLIQNPHTETIILSGRDAERFLEILENPPEPNEKLKQAFAKHQQKYDHDKGTCRGRGYCVQCEPE